MPTVSSYLPSDSGSLRLRRLWLGALSIGVLIILAIVFSSLYGAWRARRYAITATERELSNMANALADQTAWTMEAVDLLLIDTAQWYSGEGHALPGDRLNGALADRAALVQQVRTVTIVDAHGKQLYSSRAAFAPGLDVSDRSYFTAQLKGGAVGLFMSEPLLTRSEGRAVVELSRRLEDGPGHFAGVVTATLELARLQQYYSAVDLGTGGSIQLLRNDGLLVARSPATPQALGKYFLGLLRPTSSSVSRVLSPIDGQRDFVALAHVRNAPLTIAVTRSQAAALQPWRDQTTGVLVRTLILTVLAALTLAALLRQIRRAAASDRALRESEERYSLAMEGANDGHWDWQVAADHMFLSPKMKALFGQDTEAPITSRSAWLAHITIHPEDQPRFEAAVKSHFEGVTPRYECEYRVRQADGSWRWVLARGHCLRDAEGRPVRFVGSASDVTPQKIAQLDRDKLEMQLRQSQKMEAIGTLAGGIAHDFNNILGAILGYGELAQEHSEEGSPVRRYLDSVMHAAERAQMLVARILGFSRSGLGDRAPVHVQFVIEETLELLAASLPAGIRLESRIEAGNAAVIGDATYLHQVAMNLCTNALQAMERGGVLTVTLECLEVDDRRTLSRGTLALGRYVRLVVSDTGVGIAPAVLERIFDPFFTTKGVGQGTGLGLSLVHGIVSDLGGAIDVRSRLGEGTRFEIWLPVAGETATPMTAATRVLAHGNGQVVMIVDDERALVALAEEITAELGYEPVGFDSSSAALAAFRADPDRFDVLLTDEAMPELVGTELAREIRRLRPDLPILLMSGYGGTQLTSRAAEIGINEVLRKPLHRRDLAEALARVLVATSEPVGSATVSGSIAAHILVIDDDPHIRALLSEYLTENGLRVSAAATRQQMEQVLKDEAVDLVVLDLRLGGDDGMAIARSLRDQSAIPIVMLTGVRDEADRVMGLELGADDYLTKPFSPRELLARIRTVLRRTKSALPAGGTDRARQIRAYRFGQFELNLGTRRLKRSDGSQIALTNGEFNLLAALLAAPERILTRDQLLEASRVYDNEVYDRAIDIQILRLRRKIESDPAQPQFIVTERGAGYIFCSPVEILS